MPGCYLYLPTFNTQKEYTTNWNGSLADDLEETIMS